MDTLASSQARDVLANNDNLTRIKTWVDVIAEFVIRHRTSNIN